MSAFSFALVDVFAQEPLTGNPLAVVEGGERLPDDLLRAIAREFNQAETTFVMRSKVADRKLRSFTAAGAEVFGAGHNALGAWLWLADEGALGDLNEPTTFHQEIGEVVLPVKLARIDGVVHGSMRQSPMKLGSCSPDLMTLAEALSLAAGELLGDPAPLAVDTGASHLMVRAQGRESVDNARPNADLLHLLLEQSGAEGCYLYAIDGRTSESAYARFFNPTVGLWEDSATGTAAGPLCAYLASQGYLPASRVVIEQGTSMGRPSFINVQLGPDPEISGAGVVVAKGTLQL